MSHAPSKTLTGRSGHTTLLKPESPVMCADGLPAATRYEEHKSMSTQKLSRQREVLHHDVATPRGREHVREVAVASDQHTRATILFVHGNCSSSAFFDPLISTLPDGMRDYADDVTAVLDAVDVARPLIVVAHSAGAGVVMQMAIDRPDAFDAFVLEAPMSPYGFGGSRDPDGRPLSPDFAGSGGGTA